MADSYGEFTGTLSEALCQKTQIAMGQVFNANNPETKMGMNGTLMSTLENNTGVQMLVDPGDGSRNEATTMSKSVEVHVNPRYHKDGALTALATGCSAGDQPAKQAFTLYADTPLQSETITMNELEYRRYCEGAVAYKDNRLVALGNQVVEALNDQLLFHLVGEVGKYKGGATTNTFNILNATTLSQRFPGFVDLKKKMAEARLNDMVNIIGWGKWFNYFMNAENGGLQDSGARVERSAERSVFYPDDNVANASAFGDEDAALIMGKDSVAFHTWNAWKGQYRKLAPEEIKTTIVHPSGIELDLYGFYTKCENSKTEYQSGNWSFRYTVHWGAQAIPQEAWKPDDPLYGINYLFKAVAAAV